MSIRQDLRYDQVSFKASHNSYEREEQPACCHLDWDAARPFDRGCRGLEFDLVQSSHRWEWCVRHDRPFDPNVPFSQTLSELDAWSTQHPGHDPVTVHLDIKNQPRDDGAYPGEFDRYLQTHFGTAKLYRPRDLIGLRADLMSGARLNGWPTLEELQGKFIFCLSGRKATKERYSAQQPKERLCFADQEVTVKENIWKPSLERGDRVFFNFFLTPSKVDLAPEMAWYAQQAGLITRFYVLNDRHLWTGARAGRPSILSTDKVGKVEWAKVGDDAFAPRVS